MPGVTPSGIRWAVGWCLLVAVLSSLMAAEASRASGSLPNPRGDGVVVTGAGLVLPVREILADGFRVITPCWNEGFVRSGSYLGSVDVVLDPGHGGVETGAFGPGGTIEKDLNLTIAELVADTLRSRGYRVLLTRTTDVRIHIVVRAEIARASDPLVFVSIHHNSGAKRRSTDPGTEIYHQAANPDSERLAGLLYEEVYAALSRHDIGWVDTVLQGANAVVDRQDGTDWYGVLRYTPGIASTIVEAAYLSNAAEERLLGNPAVQSEEALAIASGIERYLTTDDPGSGYNGTHPTSKIGTTGGIENCVDPPLEPDPEHGPPIGIRYADAVGGIHGEAIDALGEMSILEQTECGPDLLCPEAPIQRWLLAVWLVRLLEKDEPPPVSISRFEDVAADGWWAPYVEHLAASGITEGCSTEPARFCPHSIVTRAQMASFLVRAFGLGPGEASEFTDIEGNPHSSAISALASAGITAGCAADPARYCPRLPTTKAQAAALLNRALDYRLAPPESAFEVRSGAP